MGGSRRRLLVILRLRAFTVGAAGAARTRAGPVATHFPATAEGVLSKSLRAPGGLIRASAAHSNPQRSVGVRNR